MNKQIVLSILCAGMAMQVSAQADRQLSNLQYGTKVNLHLLPAGNNTKDLGEADSSWRDLYLDGLIYLDKVKFVSNVGAQSAFVGYQAGNMNAGSGNSALGYRSLFNNTNGSNNTAAGANALRANTIGSFNSSAGSFALYKNTTGNSNTANGHGALYSNMTGSRNVAIGNKALFSSVDDNGNVAIGDSALYKFNNPVIPGDEFPFENELLVAVGQHALASNTRGVHNTGSGGHSLLSNSTGSFNTANGASALEKNTTGSCNTAVGAGALDNNITGRGNTAIGCDANIFINGLFNATAIGSGAVALGSNQVMLGNTSVTSVRAAGRFVIISDGRFKSNKKENVPGLDFIKELKPVTYNYNIRKLNDYLKPSVNKAEATGKAEDCCSAEEAEAIANKEKQLYTGFVAQEVEAAAKKLGYDFSGVYKPENGKDVYGLSYSDFVVPLVKAIQELSAENDVLKIQNKEIETRLQKQIDELKAMIITNSHTKVSSLSSGATHSNASLEQNVPNPFSKTTTVSYTLPQKFSSAQIVIRDQSGKTLKQIPISGNGKGTINIDSGILSSGAYLYSLIVDGRVISSKQMIFIK